MNDVYIKVMRMTAPILFAVALLILVASVIGTISILQSMSDGSHGRFISPWAEAGIALITGLQAAAWPLVGAALVWRADRWLEGRGGAAK